jgi:hypothetical protein
MAKLNLEMATAFGSSLADAILLARDADDDGESRPKTFVVRVDGGKTRVAEVLEGPSTQAWRSANGTAYVTSDRGELWVHQGGAWSRERVCEEQVAFRPIWGFGGATPRDDVVLVATDTSLHERRGGAWRSFEIPESAEMVFRLHGLRPDAVFMTTADGLRRWDGEKLGRPGSPPMPELSGVRAVSEDELVVTGDGQLFRKAGGGRWETIAAAGGGRHTIAVETFGGKVWVGTSKGVVRLDGATPSLVTNVYCNQLVNLGDHLLASGHGTLLFDGQSWRPLALPTARAGSARPAKAAARAKSGSRSTRKARPRRSPRRSR